MNQRPGHTSVRGKVYIMQLDLATGRHDLQHRKGVRLSFMLPWNSDSSIGVDSTSVGALETPPIAQRTLERRCLVGLARPGSPDLMARSDVWPTFWRSTTLGYCSTGRVVACHPVFSSEDT